jgi:hypothetical protein
MLVEWDEALVEKKEVDAGKRDEALGERGGMLV